MKIQGKALKVGVAGLGFGAAVHVPAYAAIDNVQVIGLAGREAARTEAMARQAGVLHACVGIEALLDLGLDAISLALPPAEVAAAARLALARGIPILCEKPLGKNAEEAHALVRLAKGQFTAMDFIFSELDTFKRLKQIIDTRQLDAVRHVNVFWLTES
jgi:predicted dehydrogenase